MQNPYWKINSITEFTEMTGHGRQNQNQDY